MPSPPHRQRHSNASLLQANSNSALRRGDIKISDPIPFNSDTYNYPPTTTKDPLNATASPMQPDGTWRRKGSPNAEMQHVRTTSIGQGERLELSRASAGPSLVTSSLSAGPSKNSLSQKRTGGFRATLKRMFSTKKARSLLVDDRYEFHRSDPGNLTSITEGRRGSRVTRVPSQTGGIVTQASALHSHNPVVEHMPRTSAERNRLKSPRRPRRNTVPSLILTEQEAQILAGPKDDFDLQNWKRPEDSERQMKRRSRSADALNDLINEFNFDAPATKTREDEIKYWRTSVIENPPPQLPNSLGDRRGDEHLTPNQNAPIQTFDFGLQRPGVEAASLEERVNTLEIKLFDFEYAIAKLQGHDIPKPLLFPKAPPKRRSIHDLFPESSNKSTVTSSSSSAEPTSFLASPGDSPMPSLEDEEQFKPDRSSKATTVRPFTARPTSQRRSAAPSPSPSRPTTEQVEKLMDMVKEEQAARRQLEIQVLELQREIAVLRTPIYAAISYPTPSPESIHETPRPLHRSPRFQHEKTPQPQETSRFSMSDLESDTDDGYQDVYETPQENRFTFETSRGSPLVGVY